MFLLYIVYILAYIGAGYAIAEILKIKDDIYYILVILCWPGLVAALLVFFVLIILFSILFG